MAAMNMSPAIPDEQSRYACFIKTPAEVRSRNQAIHAWPRRGNRNQSRRSETKLEIDTMLDGEKLSMTVAQVWAGGPWHLTEPSASQSSKRCNEFRSKRVWEAERPGRVGFQPE